MARSTLSLVRLLSALMGCWAAGMLHFDSSRGVLFRMVRLNYKKCCCLHIIVTNILFRHLMVAANFCCRSLIRMPPVPCPFSLSLSLSHSLLLRSHLHLSACASV